MAWIALVGDAHGQAVFKVPFAHPRKLSSAPVQELRATILRELGVDSYST